MIVPALKIGQTIVVKTYSLLHDHKLLIRNLLRDPEGADGLIEKEEDVVQPRNWGQEDAAGHQVLAAEAGQEMQVGDLDI